jgi:ketosteroid isomerase-like protein
LGRLVGNKKDNGAVDHWNRRTIALRRLDGEWRIIHEHNSYPIKMDGSLKAATDLTP